MLGPWSYNFEIVEWLELFEWLFELVEWFAWVVVIFGDDNLEDVDTNVEVDE